MDSVKELLESWTIPEEIVNIFVENGITVEHLPKLKPENLKELCPHMGTRIHLQEKIDELVTAHAPTEANSSESSQVQLLGVGDTSTHNASVIISLDEIKVANIFETSPSIPRKTFPNFDLETLLQTSAGGSSILKYYETYGFLDNTKRNQLVDIIIKHIYTYIVNCRITYEEYNVIAAKIISLFPKESIGTYYTKPITKRNSLNGRSTIARGKLVDKVRNLLYKYGDRKRPSTYELENTPPTKKNIEDLQNVHSRDILFLNNNTEPWDEVMQKWKNTFNVRKESEYLNVHEFLQDWKILSDQRSDILINIDFDLLYPEKGLNFYLNWDTFFEKLIAQQRPRDEKTKNLIESLKNIEDNCPYVSGYLSNWKGRKPSLFVGGTLTLLSFLILAVARDLTTILVGRIFTGLGTGIIFVINLVYLGEIASPIIRGILLTGTGIFGTFGTLVVFSVGPYVPYYAVSVVGLSLSVLYIAGLFYIPETPLFHILKDRQKEAKVILQFLGRDESIESIYSPKLHEENGQWRDLFTIKNNRNAVLITLPLNILQQMSGVVVVQFFATTIFELAGSSIEPNIATIIIGVTQIVASCIAPFFVERSGRRVLLLISTAVCCLSLCTLGFYFYIDDAGFPVASKIKWLPLVTLIIFFLSYDLGFGIIPGTLTGEIFQSNVRSTGSTLTITIAWLAGFGVSSAFGYLITAIGGYGTFWLFSGSCALAFILTIFCVPETRGKTFEQIQEMLK